MDAAVLARQSWRAGHSTTEQRSSAWVERQLGKIHAALHYMTAARQRAAGVPQGRNSPAELPRIGAEVAALRGVPPDAWAAITSANACAALPRLHGLWVQQQAAGAGLENHQKL